MSHEFYNPDCHEVAKVHEPLTLDSNESDTRLVAGTRKLMMAMFWLLKIPPLPSQEELDADLAEVAKEYHDTDPPVV